MKSKFIYKALGLLLGTTIMIMSSNTEAAAESAEQAKTKIQETTVATLSENDIPDDIWVFDWKKATNTEMNRILQQTEWSIIGDWLFSKTEEELQELLKRDTLLKQKTMVYNYELEESSEGTDKTDCSYKQIGKTETTFYEYALSKRSMNTKAASKRTFGNNQGVYSIECVFPEKTYTYAIRLSGIDTTKVISEQQKKLTLTVTGEFWPGLTFLDNNSVNLRLDFGVDPANQSTIPYYVYLYENWQLVKPEGYNVTKSSQGQSGAFGICIKNKNSVNYEFDISNNKYTWWDGDAGEYGAATYKLVTHSNIIRDLGVSDSQGATTMYGVHRLVFTPAIYNVNYHGNGATSGSVSAQNCRYGTTYTTQSNGFTRAYTITYNGNGGNSAVSNQVARYGFLGWGFGNTASANYGAGQAYANLTAANGGVVDMYAIWNPAGVELPKATRVGYQFKGWNIGGIIMNAGAGYTPAADVTAIAEWSPNTYVIDLESNGGTEYANINGIYGEDVILPTPSKAGYTFNGWVGEGGTYKGTVKNLTDVNKATINLTADWSANTDTKYTIQYWKQPATDVTDTSKYELFEKGKGDAIEGVEIHHGVTDSTINIPPVVVEGYDTPEAKVITVKGDGSTVVNFYYNITKKIEITSPGSGGTTPGNGGTTPGNGGTAPGIGTVTPEIEIKQEHIDEIVKRLAAGLSFSLDLNGATYEILQNDDGTLGIKFISTNESRLVIPDMVTIGEKVYRITEIYAEAFKGNTTIREMELSANISKIGDAAFEGCTSLEKITLHDGLVAIGNNAFEGCTSLADLKTPATLQTIGDYAFQNCISLKKATLNTGLMKIGMKAFYNCSALSKITIPRSVLKIGGFAFGNCIKLKNVTFAPDCQLLSMGTGVFYDCKVLSKITLPDKLTGVPSKCFYGCNALKKLKIGKAVTKISNNAFRNCYKLSSVTGGNALVSIGTSAFQNCRSLTKITIPAKVQSVGKTAFYNCKKLQNVTVKSKVVTNVGSKAFKKCKKSIKFVVPKSKKSAYQKLFRGKY